MSSKMKKIRDEIQLILFKDKNASFQLMKKVNKVFKRLNEENG